MKTDAKKLEEELEIYTKKHEVFTSEMVHDHLLNTNIKFKKDMNRKKIGQYLARHYKSTRKNNRNYYYV